MTQRRQTLMLGSCVLIALVTLADVGTSAAGKPTRRTIVVPAKTTLDVRLATSVASEGNRQDDRVLASLATPVIVDGVYVAPAASVLLGNVAAQEPAPAGGSRHLALRFDRLRVGPTTYDIRTAPVRIASEGAPSGDDGVRMSSGTRLRLELLEPVSIDVPRVR